MKFPLRGDKGAALGMVLIFVSIFSVWLSATLLISQTAAAAVARAQQANVDASATASLTAATLTELETKALELGLSTQADCGLTIPTQTFDGTTFSVECAPAADGTFGTSTNDSIILVGTSGTVGTQQGIKNGGTSSQKVTIINVDGTTSGKKSDMRNNGSTATDGNITLDGTAKVKPDQQCSTTGSTGLVAGACDKGADKSDITKGETKDLWQAMKQGGPKATNTVTSLTLRCANGALNSTSVQTQTGVDRRGNPVYATTVTSTMTLLPGIYGAAEVTTLNAIINGATTSATGCGKNWVDADTRHLYFSPGTYIFRGTTVLNVNNVKAVLSGRMPKTDGTWVPCERPAAKAGLSDLDLMSSPDGFELQFEDSARITLQNGKVELCPTSYALLPQHSIYADTLFTGVDLDIVRMTLPSGSANPIFISHGLIYAPTASLYFQAAQESSVQLLGGTAVKAITIVPPPTATNFTLTTGSQKTTGERYVTLTVKATKDGVTRTVSKTTVRLKDAYATKTDSTGKTRPTGYVVKRSR